MPKPKGLRNPLFEVKRITDNSHNIRAQSSANSSIKAYAMGRTGSGRLEVEHAIATCAITALFKDSFCGDGSHMIFTLN
jgi:hypothetical protein